jgi:hypothetical protein
MYTLFSCVIGHLKKNCHTSSQNALLHLTSWISQCCKRLVRSIHQPADRLLEALCQTTKPFTRTSFLHPTVVTSNTSRASSFKYKGCFVPPSIARICVAVATVCFSTFSPALQGTCDKEYRLRRRDPRVFCGADHPRDVRGPGEVQADVAGEDPARHGRRETPEATRTTDVLLHRSERRRYFKLRVSVFDPLAPRAGIELESQISISPLQQGESLRTISDVGCSALFRLLNSILAFLACSRFHNLIPECQKEILAGFHNFDKVRISPFSGKLD